MKIPVAIKILNEATGPKANVEFMDVSILKIGKNTYLQDLIGFLFLVFHHIKPDNRSPQFKLKFDK